VKREKCKIKNNFNYLSAISRGLILIGMVMLAGCWDVQEIKSRSIANTVFFDMENPKKLKIGISTNIPGTLAPTNVGTYQQFNKRNILVTGEGDSMVKAWSEIQANAARDIFFGQMRAVVISERLAQENINDYLDFIGRIPLVPPNTVVLVSKNDPEKLLDIKNRENELPGNWLDYYFRNPTKRSLAIPVDLWRVNAIMDRKTGDPYIPLLGESEGSYKVAGTAVFSRNRLSGELSMDETITLSLLRGTDYGYLTVPIEKNKYAAFKNIRAKTNVSPKISADGGVSFSVRTEISGNMVENFPHRETLMKEKRNIERQAEIETKRSIKNLIIKLQGFNSDPVEFGRKLKIKYPRQWKQIDWHQIYPVAKFNVSTKFILKETGLFR
jgi:spore germination protein KC